MSDANGRPEVRWLPIDLPWRALLVATLAGLLVRLAFGFGYWVDKPLTRDEQEYLALARNVAAGRGFVYDDELMAGPNKPFGRAPGYPAFLALVGGDAPSATVPRSVQAAQSVVGAIGVLLMGIVAHRLGGPKMAVAAAAMAAVYPPLVWVAGYAMSEAIFWPIGLLTAWSFDRSRADPNRPGLALLSGLVIGAGVLVRPAMIFFLPLAAGIHLLSRRYRLAAALVIGTVLVVGPWTARNYQHYGKLIFVASEGGVTFWTGNHPLAIGEGDMAANPAIKIDHLRLRAAHPGLSEEDAEPIYYREALAWIAAHPGAWLWLECRKLFYLVVPIGPSYTLHSTRYYALSLISYIPVLTLAIVSVLSRRAVLSAGLALLAASAVVVALLFFPQERFRIPIIDPTLIILASALVATFRRMPGRS